jgi:hypothetical protein
MQQVIKQKRVNFITKFWVDSKKRSEYISLTTYKYNNTVETVRRVMYHIFIFNYFTLNSNVEVQ